MVEGPDRSTTTHVSGDYTGKHSTMLADLLQSTFALHRARITCLATIVVALFKSLS